MRRVLEVIFRHPLRLLALLILLPAIGLGVAFFLPRNYQTTTSLWALRRYSIIGATGPESNLLATPADTQVTALTELLQSRSFALIVAHQTNLADTLDSSLQGNQQRLDDAMFDEISKQVKVVSSGYNLFSISYTNHNPKIAEQVVSAVIQAYGQEGQNFSVAEGQRLQSSYQTQLAQAQQNLQIATAAETQYIAKHPNVSRADLQTDPQYTLLHSQTQQAQLAVQDVQNNIATLNQTISSQGTTAASLFRVLDSPEVPTKPVSRTKELLIGGGVGLGIAVLASAIYVLVSLRRNRVVYTPADLQDVASLPVVMQLPKLSAEAMPLLIPAWSQDAYME